MPILLLFPQSTITPSPKQLLEAKKHVLAEKTDYTLIPKMQKTLCRIAKENNCIWMDRSFTLLFHPAIRKIKELIQTGKIGKFTIYLLQPT